MSCSLCQEIQVIEITLCSTPELATTLSESVFEIEGMLYDIEDESYAVRLKPVAVLSDPDKLQYVQSQLWLLLANSNIT